MTLGTMSCVLRADTSPVPPPASPSAAETAPAQTSHWAEQVVLGSSTVDLTGPWKFHRGDNMGWAQPDYNDSGWSSMDLTPPAGSYDPFLGTSGFVPGWTALGDAGYAGYAWYRLKVNVQYDAGLSEGGLEIKMPDDVDDAYQVFVNGEMVGQFGRFTQHGVTTYLTLPRTFALPKGIKSGQVTIAVRVWMDPSTALTNPDAGGLHGPPILGQSGPIERMLRLDWDSVNRSQLSRFLELAVLLLAITVAIILFWLDRKEKAYRWLAIACAGVALQTVVTLIGNYTAFVPATIFFLLTDAILVPGVIGLWIIFWAYWFRMGRIPRLHKMVWGFTLALAITIAMMRAPLYGHLVPVHSVAIFVAADHLPQVVARRIAALGGVGRHAQGPCGRVAGDACRRPGDRFALSAGITGAAHTAAFLPVRVGGGYQPDRSGGIAQYHHDPSDAALPRVS